MNPFLGCRAIRYSLANEDMFRAQLRAIIRTAQLGEVRVMFPMISNVYEVKRAREIFEDVSDRLVKEGKVDRDRIPPIGIMIEIPSAALSLYTASSRDGVA